MGRHGLAVVVLVAGCGGSAPGSSESTSDGSSGGSDATAGTDAGTTSVATSATTDASTISASTVDTGTDAGDACGGDPCIPSAPPRWNGPVAVEVIPFDDRGACPDGWTDVETAGAFGELDAPDLACACASCELQGTCDDPILQAYMAAGCGVQAGNPIVLTPDVCHGNFLFLYFEVARPQPEGVACSATPSDDGSVAPTFATRARVCAPPPADGCDGGVCWDESAVPPAAGVCLWQDGDVPCPPGWPEKNLHHRSFVDDRACTCACDPIDPLCDGTITGWWGDPCFGNVEEIAFDTCTYAQTQSWMYEGGLTGSCSEPAAAQTGSIAPTDPVTFCCA